MRNKRKTMKKTLLIVLSIFCLNSIFGQKNMSIGINIHKTELSNKLDEDPYFRGRLESKSGYGINLAKKYALNSRFALSVGLGYDKSSYVLNTNDFIWPNQVTGNGVLPQHVIASSGAIGIFFGERTFHSIALPIHLHSHAWDIGFGSIGVRLGLIPSYYVSAKNEIELDSGINQSDLLMDLNRFNVNGSLGLDLMVYRNENISLSIIPSVRAEITSSGEGIKDHKMLFASIGFELGIL